MPPDLPHDPAADHLASLYLTDRNGRLTGINQWDGGTVPRFHLVRSPHGNHWRFRHDLQTDLVRALERLCRAEPVAASPDTDPQLADPCIALLNEAAPVTAVWRGPAFAFPLQVASMPDPAVVTVTRDNADLLARWLPDWLPDVQHRAPFLAVLEDGAAAAVCASVRITPRAHAAGVETHPAFRRRGLGSRVVGAWAAAVSRTGAQPIYSTSWGNRASLGVAAGLNLSLLATDFHVT